MQFSREKIEGLSRSLFPFKTPNPGQIEVIVDAVEMLVSGTKHVIIEAPTGVGKSVIAKTIHLVMSQLMDTWRTGIITATKGLQDQYKKDMPEIFVLKGKSNYTCPFSTTTVYGTQPCIVQQRQEKNRCDAKSDCPYVKARDQFLKKAPFRITNNAFQIIAPEDMIANPETIVDLLVCDESHELEGTIIDNSAVVIDLNEARMMVMDTGFTGVYSQIDEFFKILSTKKKSQPFFFSKDELTLISEEYLPVFQKFHFGAEAKSKVQDSFAPVAEYALKLLQYTRTVLKGIEWIATKHENLLQEIKPVYASDVAEDALFRKANQFIHMSATICGFPEYAKSLGLQDWKSIEISNPIPVQNRKVIAFPLFYLGRQFSDWEKYNKVMNVIAKKHDGQSGIIHTPSFDLANQLHNSLSEPFKSMAIVSNKRQDIMQHLTTPGSIVISPSVFQGYDFKNDLARWQIVAKVPFGFLGDPHIKLNSERMPHWYKRNAILKVVQMAGRVVRGVDDWGITYVLDAQFLRLAENDNYLFPEWFLDAIVIAE